MSAATRELEYKSVSAGTYEMEGERETVISAAGTTFQLQPEKRSGWKTDTHFHSDLCIPASDDDSMNSSLLFCFEGRAREGLAVSLSPAAKFKGTEIVLGAQGNTCTVIQTKQTANNRHVVNAPGRVCREDVWTSYWICISGDKLRVGVGAVPGEQCIATVENAAQPNQQHPRFVGIRNAGTADRQPPTALRVRNLKLSMVPTELAEQLAVLKNEDVVDMIVLGEDCLQDLSATDKETVMLLCTYRDECTKAKTRAVKFGVAYQAPDLAATMPWSQARRLRANPVAVSGFVTGMDVTTDAEKVKQEQRKARFGSTTNSKSGEDDAKDEPEVAAAAVGMDTDSAFPVDQAWDKIELVGNHHRVDPPAALWKDPPPAQDKDEFRMVEEVPVLASEKIHMCSIDWAAFKQIRTNDILAHFSIYGPSYVEWLGDLSCNVLFEDKFSAARALENMSQELPSPPPPTTEAPTADDAAADEGTTADSAAPLPDLGRMGWRLGKSPLRKVANDRYGRQGTTARLLLRVATSLDILHERPTKWPKPPPGFTTKRMLGPESDLPREKNKKEKKRNRNDESSNNRGPATTESLMSQGLSSARGGFSVEEMEAERAKKKTKVSES